MVIRKPKRSGMPSWFRSVVTFLHASAKVSEVPAALFPVQVRVHQGIFVKDIFVVVQAILEFSKGRPTNLPSGMVSSTIRSMEEIVLAHFPIIGEELIDGHHRP